MLEKRVTTPDYEVHPECANKLVTDNRLKLKGLRPKQKAKLAGTDIINLDGIRR